MTTTKVWGGAAVFFVAAALFAFTASLTALAAPVSIFSEGFESAGNLSGWTAAGQWNENLIPGVFVHSGNRAAVVQGNTGSSADNLDKAISTAGYSNITLSYWYRVMAALGSSDHVLVQWSSDSGATWNTVADYTNVSAGAWTQATFVLPANTTDAAGFRIRFQAAFNGPLDALRIDDIELSGEPLPATVKVTIVKYINGAPATAENTSSAAFPMHAIFPGGEGNYALSAAGFNNPDPYKATTSDMPLYSEYSTYETAPEQCTAAYPYKLAGYTTGSTLEEAAGETPTLDVPAFTDLIGDKFVVVWNLTCPPAPVHLTPANDSTLTSAEATLIDWTDVTDWVASAITYFYQVSNTSGAVNGDGSLVSPLLDIGPLVDSQIPTPGTPPGEYYWHVRAVDGAGNAGPWSAPWHLTVTAAPSCNSAATQTLLSSTATQVDGHDAVPVPPIAGVLPGAWSADIAGATWIWSELPDEVGTHASPVSKVFTQTFTIIGTPQDSSIEIASDNAYTVQMNGDVVASSAGDSNFSSATTVAIPASYLVSGENTLSITIVNAIAPEGYTGPNPGGLLYKLVINSDDCAIPPPPEPTFAKVHIYKYLDTGESESQVADEADFAPFPMLATWDAVINGAPSAGTNVSYFLGDGHGGAAFDYAADTAPMQAPVALYHSEESLSEEGPVLPIGATCQEGMFRLVGYRSGASLGAAQIAELSGTAPTFTNFSTDQYLIVVNEECPDDVPPAPIKVHIFKYLEDGENIEQIPNDSSAPAFPMIAKYDIAGVGTNLNPGDGYVLGDFGGVGGSDDGLKYAANTLTLSVGDDYGTNEVTDGSVVVASEELCATGKYYLVGYQVGDSLEAAEGASISTEAPFFTDITSAKYVIVINAECEEESETPTETFETLIVTDSSMQGWSLFNFDDDDSSDDSSTTTSGTGGYFITGPTTPPLSTGSFMQEVGTNGNDATRLRSSDYNGTPLADITSLSYQTYVSVNGGGQATYIQLRIDRDANGAWDDALFFEPVYQNGTYGMLYGQPNVPNQCVGDPNCVVLNTWQPWDPMAGGWWSSTDSAGGPPLTTIAKYVEQYPNAILALDVPAIRIQAGAGAPVWNNFRGNFDEFVIGVQTGLNTETTTYDFEPLTDEDEDEEVVETLSFSGGGGGGGGGGPVGLFGSSNTGPGGQVLGAQTGPDTEECSNPLLTTYMRMGMKNDPSQVSLLQTFLNGEMGSSLPVSGFFGIMTQNTVKQFQLKYAADILTPWGITEPTGFVYKLTQRKINLMTCSTLNLPYPVLD